MPVFLFGDHFWAQTEAAGSSILKTLALPPLNPSGRQVLLALQTSRVNLTWADLSPFSAFAANPTVVHKQIKMNDMLHLILNFITLLSYKMARGHGN